MKKLLAIAAIISIFFFQYCSSPKKSASVKPAIAAYTYIKDIQPTIQAKCSPCHIPPKGFQRAFDSYPAAKEYISDIIRRIKLKPNEQGFMPFKHEKLSDSIINIFVKWNEQSLAEK